MHKYSIDEIMEMAIQTEILGYQFYTGMAEKFKKDDGLVKLFSTLATKEKTHEKTFKGLKESVAKTGSSRCSGKMSATTCGPSWNPNFFLAGPKPSRPWITSRPCRTP